MNKTNFRWQIKDTAGRVVVDHVSHAIALEMLSILQQHNWTVTLRLVEGEQQ